LDLDGTLVDSTTVESALRSAAEDTNAAVGPRPGALRLLGALPSGSWAVVTGCSVRSAEARIQRAGLPEPPILITADDVVEGTPHPELLLRAMGVLDVPADECIVIDHSPHGIASGLAAGVRVLAVGTTVPAHLRDDASWLVPTLEAITITTERDRICLSWPTD
jgi:sugar-phosphatase